MAIFELKNKINQYRESLKNKSGKLCNFSETGPVGMSVIDDIVSTLETMEKRITKLERKTKHKRV